MTRGDAEDYSRKHGPDERPEGRLAEALQKKAESGKISCSAVFGIVSDLKVRPEEAGKALDLLNIKLVKCQLGLFGYEPGRSIVKPSEEVSPEMASAIRAGCVDKGLPCLRAWEIAEERKVKKMQVASAAEALQVKIRPCQLGAF